MVIKPAMQVGSIDGIKENQTSGWGREGNWSVIQEFPDLRDCRFKTSLIYPHFAFIYLPSDHFSSDWVYLFTFGLGCE